MLLAGTRVLEWAEGLAAPYATRILADLGAEVLKIESPQGGDPLRREEPLAPEGGLAEGALFAALNHGKRSLSLDPTRPGGARLFRELAGRSQILLTSRPPALLSQNGFAPSALQATNPALVVLELSLFGESGAFKDTAGSDLTVLFASGFAYHSARPVGEPENQPPLGGADREAPLAFGLAAAFAALSGLMAAQTSGRGPTIEMAQFDFFAQMLIEPLAEYCEGERGFERRRREFRGTEVAGGLIWVLGCADGWVLVSPREDHQWKRWMELLGDPPWAADAALCGDRLARKKNWSALQALMSQWTLQHKKESVFERAQAARVACFPVSTAGDILGNAQLASRRFFDRLRLPSGVSLSLPGLPFLFRDGKGQELERGRACEAPALGEANEAIFAGELALSPSEIETLREQRVL